MSSHQRHAYDERRTKEDRVQVCDSWILMMKLPVRNAGSHAFHAFTLSAMGNKWPKERSDNM